MDKGLDAIAGLLSFFYGLWPSYGGAIILLTLVIMTGLMPWTLKGTKSMIAMQQLQPELKRLQAEYKDDRERLNEEVMKFYKENEINPLSGCLPLLIQMPVLMILFGVLRGLTRRVSDVGAAAGWAVGEHVAGGTSTPIDVDVLGHKVFDPAFLDHGSELYRALSHSTTMKWLGVDLAESLATSTSKGLGHAMPYFGLIVLVLLTSVYQQRQITARSTGEQNQQQQMMAKIMPLMMPLISYSLPAGLVLYFAISNVFRIGQQAWITRTLYPHVASTKVSPGGAAASAAGVAKKQATASGAAESKAKAKKPTDAKVIDTTASETKATRAASTPKGAGEGTTKPRKPPPNKKKKRK